MIDTSELANKFEQGEEVYIGFQFYNDEIMSAINSLMAKILSRADRMYLLDSMSAIMRELVQNAVKANAKRIFFTNNSLDINNPENYSRGMKKFRNVALKLSSIKEDLISSSYRTVIKFRKANSRMEFEINNNARIHPDEMERITFRIKKSIECMNFADAYERVYDPSEGAGLGIVLTVLLLKNAGLDPALFKILTDEESVKIRITIPAEIQKAEIVSEIKNKIIEDVNTLPTFPENIIELQAMCRNPVTTIDSISLKISLDPSLTADVLRLSNSAGFITGKRIEKINEAVMVIGLKNLNSILSAAATRKILDKRYRRFEKIWDHCNKTAFYARNIAEELQLHKITDSAFIAGLLHDIGKIVLLSTDIDLVNKISEIVKNRKLRTSTILEEIAIGISHSTIGSLIAEKWNFPDELIEAIRFHHSPLKRDIKYRETVMVVYLANLMSTIEIKNFDLSFIESEVLSRLNIKSESEFNKFHKKIMKKYNRHYSSVIRKL